MEKKFRLRKNTEIRRVRRTGKSYAHPLIVLVAAEHTATRVRIGVTASKALGGAVQRNRAKRMVRAAVNPLIPTLKPGWDLLLIARKPMLEATVLQLQNALIGLLKQAGILNTQPK